MSEKCAKIAAFNSFHNKHTNLGNFMHYFIIRENVMLKKQYLVWFFFNTKYTLQAKKLRPKRIFKVFSFQVEPNLTK